MIQNNNETHLRITDLHEKLSLSSQKYSELLVQVQKAAAELDSFDKQEIKLTEELKHVTHKMNKLAKSIKHHTFTIKEEQHAIDQYNQEQHSIEESKNQTQINLQNESVILTQIQTELNGLFIFNLKPKWEMKLKH